MELNESTPAFVASHSATDLAQAATLQSFALLGRVATADEVIAALSMKGAAT